MIELKMGAELSMQKDGIDRSKQLNKFLSDIQILPIYNAIDIAAQEKVRLRLAGTPCDDNFDLLIACSAIANDMICVTDNTKDFIRFQDIRKPSRFTSWLGNPLCFAASLVEELVNLDGLPAGLETTYR